MNMELDKLYGQHIAAERAANRTPMDPIAWREEATKAGRRAIGTYSQDPTVNKAADFMRQSVYAWGRSFAERHEVPEFDRFPQDGSYAPRVFNRPEIDAYAKQYGQKDLLGRLTEAVLKGDDQRAVKNAAETLFPLPALTPEVAKEMADAQLRKANAGGQSAEARGSRRIPMDETHSWTTPDGKTWSVEDFLHNDAGALGELYNRHIIGASAAQAGFQRMSDFLRPSGEDKGPVITSRAELVKALNDGYDGLRQQDLSAAPAQSKWNKDIAIADGLVRLTEGTPLRETTTGMRVARVIGNLNIFGDMANLTTGVMNTSQVAGSMAQVGMRAAVRQFGAPFTDLIGIIRKGQVDSRLGRDVQAMGLGVEAVAHPIRPSFRVDEDGFSQIQNKAEYLAAKAARASLTASGHIATIDWMRVAVGRVAQQVWLDAALSGDGMAKALGEQRLASLGLRASDPVVGRIERHMRDHAVTEDGLYGAKLTDPMTHQWSLPDGTHDVEAVAAYRDAIALATTRAVLIPDTTDLPLWLSHPMAGLFAQFRKFALTNVRDRFGFNITMRDAAAASSMMLDVAGAAVAYAMVAYMRSLGRSDAQDYRDKMLSPERIATAAFARASWMNMIPAAIDTTAHDILGRQAIFEHARTTGLAGGLGSGNPTFDRFSKIARSFGSTQALFADDYQFSKDDLRAIQKGWWIPNLYGLDQVFQRIGNDLPDHSLEKP
jgi:hypothetical protein